MEIITAEQAKAKFITALSLRVGTELEEIMPLINSACQKGLTWAQVDFLSKGMYTLLTSIGYKIEFVPAAVDWVYRISWD